MKLLKSLKKQDLLFPWHPNSKTTARMVFTTKYQAGGLDFSEAGVPNLPDLMLDDLTIWGGADVIIIKTEKWKWSRSVRSDSLRNRVCNKCNKAFVSCLNHSPPLTLPQFVKDLSSMKLVPGAQKAGDHCSKECVAFVFPRSGQITLVFLNPAWPRLNASPSLQQHQHRMSGHLPEELRFREMKSCK